MKDSRKSFSVLTGAVLACVIFLLAIWIGWGVGRRTVSHEHGEQEAPSTYVFGSVQAGEIVRHDFSVWNLTNQPLQITNAQSTCGCTVAVVDKQTIPPKGFVLLPVTLKTAGKSGELSQPVLVSLSDGTVLTYTLKGYVSNYELGRMELGTILRGAVVAKEAILPWPPNVGLSVDRLIYNRDKLLVEISPRAGEHAITISIREDVPYGPISENVRIFTNDPLVPEKILSVFAMVSFPVSCEPEQITLGTVEPGTTSRGSARLLSPYGKTVTIDRIDQIDGLPINWEQVEGEGGDLELVVAFTPDTKQSYYKSVLRVTARAGEESRTFDVEIYGVGTALGDATGRS